MYRSVLALLFATVLLLGGCAAGQQTVPKEKSGQEANMDGAAGPEVGPQCLAWPPAADVQRYPPSGQ